MSNFSSGNLIVQRGAVMLDLDLYKLLSVMEINQMVGIIYVSKGVW